jgi:uncharacterized protein (TIGR02996 family)
MLDRAAEALRTRDYDTALRSLLAAWRENRSPDIAKRVERVGALQLAASEPWPERGVALWKRFEREVDAAEDCALAWIFARIPDMRSRREKALQRLLDDWPPDPRLSRLAVAWVADPPVGSSATGVWSRIWRLVAREADADVEARVRALDLERYRTWDDSESDMQRRQRRWLERFRAPPAIDLTAEHRQLLLRIDEVSARAERASTRGEVNDLYAEVYMHPDEDWPREVLADLLIDMGEPRGEFISAQLRIARGEGSSQLRKRARTLQAQYQDEWLGAALMAILTRSCRFERGFVAQATLRAYASHGALLTDEASTLTDLTWPGEAAFQNMSGRLRVVRDIPSWAALSAVFANAPGHPITEVHCRPMWVTWGVPEHLSPSVADRLDVLAVSDEMSGGFETMRLALERTHIGRLQVATRAVNAVSVFQALTSFGSEVIAVTARNDNQSRCARVVYTRAGDRWRVEATLEVMSRGVRELVASLPVDAAVEIKARGVLAGLLREHLGDELNRFSS